MVELTEFQRRRQENIKRNNDLLKKLHLSGVATQIKQESGVADDTVGVGTRRKKNRNDPSSAKKRKASPAVAAVPTRRSRRLKGETVEAGGIPNVNDTQLMKMGGSSPDLSGSEDLFKELKDTPVVGDVKLSDLVKSEDGQDLIEKFRSFAKNNFSSGDFFQELRERQKLNAEFPELEQLQNDFDLQLYDVFQPNEIKIVYERISSIHFHPSMDKKLIIAGDVSGNVGFWNVREEPLSETGEDDLVEPDVTRVKLFTKNVGNIKCLPTDSSKIVTSSYDGSLRTIDLETMQSEDILTLKNEYDDTMGISDIQFSYENPNLLLMTTLGGEFTSIDLREKKPDAISNLKRLADKKIGSFSINPKRPYEIATGSLDRTLKIWDLRETVAEPEWSQYDDFKSHKVVSTYDSRLSVSAVSYSPTDGTLVCNGYDDTIRLFDVNDSQAMSKDLQPALTLKHNCQTGRWTSILKARFKADQDVFAIANMKRAVDIYDSKGRQLAHLPTATVPAVLDWHSLQNWIVGGNSSGKVFLFTDKQALAENA